jgi:uncharacterized coiled-coil protein SlyX
MKAFFLIVVLVATVFVIYKQKEKIDTLTQSLTEQTDKADALQTKVTDLEKALKAAKFQAQSVSRLSGPGALQPAAQPPSNQAGSSLLDPNHRTPLDSSGKK